MIKITEWIKKLGIEENSLKTNFVRLKGNNKLIQAGNENYTVTLSKKLIPKIETIGITNRCSDGLFVLFADYDKVYKEILYKNLNVLLKRFPRELSNFYIANTEPETRDNYDQIIGSYHVVCFAKSLKKDIKKYLRFMDIDSNYKSIPLKTPHRCHVLRITKKTWRENGKTVKEKPLFVEKYPEKPIICEKSHSSAHLFVLAREWHIPNKEIDSFFDWDEKTEIEIQKYSTPKKGNL